MDQFPYLFGLLVSLAIGAYIWPARRQFMLFATAILCATLWVASVGHWRLSWQLPLSQINDTLWLEGQITSLITSEQQNRFRLTLLRFDSTTENIETRPKILTTLFGHGELVLSWQSPSCALKAGNRIRVKVKLKRFSDLANQGSFSSRRWALAKGYIARGYVVPTEHNSCLRVQPTLRQTLADKLLQMDLQNTEWILALALGERSLLSDAQWQMVHRHGISHLIAISGMHLTVVASGIFLLTVLICRALSVVWHFNQRYALLPLQIGVTLLTAFGYAWLSGFGEPVTRAWLMLSLLSVLSLSGVWLPAWKICLYSAFVLLILNPLVAYTPGVWLSFMAVLSIAFLLFRLPLLKARKGSAIMQFILLQLGISILMMPLTWLMFNGMSGSGPMVNLLAIPLVSFVLVPVCLLAMLLMLFSLSGGDWLLAHIDPVISFALSNLDDMSTGQSTYLTLSQLTLPAMIAIMALLWILWLPIRGIIKLAIGGVIAGFVMSFFVSPRQPYWQLDVLDVGQGLAVIISQDERAIVYDTGAHYPSGFNLVDAVILPVLKARGIRYLDGVYISHFDNDHAGGLEQLLNQTQLNADDVVSPVSGCHRGYQRQWLSLTLTALWPPEQLTDADENHHSCVMRISDGRHSVLLSGDIGKAQEHWLSRNATGDLPSTVLVAPHHGSNTSSGSDFISAVSPEWAVFSNGRDNRWGFPAQAVVNRYYQHNIKQVATGESGQVSFRFYAHSPYQLQVNGYADQRGAWFY